MNITIGWLRKNGACQEGSDWFLNQKLKGAVPVLKSLIKNNKHEWATWTICRLFTHKQKTQYAVFAAEQVIEIYEKEYPEDKRPRAAIDAAKAWIKSPTEKNKNAAADAAYAAGNAADAAYAAYTAAYAANAANAAANAAAAYTAADAAYAAYTAYAAAYTAGNAADAAAAYAAYTAADAAYTAADAAYTADREKLRLKILKYGLELLGGK